MFLLAYWMLVLTALARSWRAGTVADKAMVFGVLAATIAMLALQAFLNIQGELIGSFVINAMLLSAGTWYALAGQRYWPVWFAGFLGAAVLTDMAALLAAPDSLWVYRTLSGFWAIPTLLVMALGIHMDAKERRYAAPLV